MNISSIDPLTLPSLPLAERSHSCPRCGHPLPEWEIIKELTLVDKYPPTGLVEA